MTGHLKKISEAEKDTRNNIAPGAGGFSGAFYKAFWFYLMQVVLGAIHQVFEDKQCPVSLRLGIIAVIPKGTKNRRYFVN